MRYTKPSALKIGHGLNKCCQILKGEACQREDDLKVKQLDAFQQAMNSSLHVEISSTAIHR